MSNSSWEAQSCYSGYTESPLESSGSSNGPGGCGRQRASTLPVQASLLPPLMPPLLPPLLPPWQRFSHEVTQHIESWGTPLLQSHYWGDHSSRPTLLPRVNPNEWLPEDESLLESLRKSSMMWDDIASQLPGRNDTDCRHKYKLILEMRISTIERDKDALDRVMKCIKRDMENLGRELAQESLRPEPAMEYVPRQHAGPTPREARKWSECEITLLRNLREYGMNWDAIAEQLSGRSANSCRLRYRQCQEEQG